MAEATSQTVLTAEEYILQEEIRFKTERVSLDENWDWNFYDHRSKSFLYKHGKFTTGANDGTRPNKNIILPILNVGYRATGFDVKDIQPFVNDPDNYYKSFFFKKYHPKWARKNDIDTAIDESVESFVDYGLVLMKNVGENRPEVVPLHRIAFCDQTDILSGPICEKHQYSPAQLMEMAGKWDKNKIEEAILMAEAQKTTTPGRKTKTPGKYIEVYELHGTFPETWLNKSGESKYTDDTKFVSQVQIICYYRSEDRRRNGIVLYKGIEPKSIYKALKRDDVYGRACGYGGVEELFEPQTWTNYNEIQMKKMLDAAALMIITTTDKKFAQQKLSDLDQNEIMLLSENTDASQLTIQPQNRTMFEQAVINWEQHARTTGSASDPQLGLAPVSGTPLGTTQIITNQGEGSHAYRRGKLATFWGEIYRDWVLPGYVEEINQGQEWLDELTVDELQEVAEAIVRKKVHGEDGILRKKIMSGERPTPEEVELIETMEREAFVAGGNKHFLKTLRGEMSDLPIDVDISVAGKQKDLPKAADALNNILRTVIANPQGFMATMQIPGMSSSYNQVLEYAGLNPINFAGVTRKMMQNMAPQEPAQGQPTQALPVAQ